MTNYKRTSKFVINNKQKEKKLNKIMKLAISIIFGAASALKIREGAPDCPEEGMWQGYDECFGTTACSADGDEGTYILGERGDEYYWYTWSEYDCYCEDECDEGGEGEGEGEGEDGPPDCPEEGMGQYQDECYDTWYCSAGDESNGGYFLGEEGYYWVNWDDWACECYNYCPESGPTGLDAFPDLECPSEGQTMVFDDCEVYNTARCSADGDDYYEYYDETYGWFIIYVDEREWYC